MLAHSFLVALKNRGGLLSATSPVAFAAARRPIISRMLI
jgi:hypothetical protein